MFCYGRNQFVIGRPRERCSGGGVEHLDARRGEEDELLRDPARIHVGEARFQRSRPVRRGAAIDAGEPGKMSSAARARNCLVSSVALIWLNHPASRSMIGRGVPAGTTTPHHGEMSKSLKPCSTIVGTSGSA